MANRFNRGLNSVPANTAPAAALPVKDCKNEDLLILVLLFILLAASPALGLESRYFFIIIMAILGLGGVDKAFGLSR
ncbi:MAG TPA: hypothetical protein VN580_08525 [Clostridia bacterium]|nr:hypothetical protein [Clostridia bacterium]